MEKLNESEDMHILFFDTETNGMVDWKSPSDGKDQPHIVQLAAHVVKASTRKVIQSVNVIVRPDNWEIPQEMTDIHGITMDQAVGVGVPESLALDIILMMQESCDLRVAHNTTFDNRIIRIAAKRYGDEDAVGDWKDGQYFCTCQNARKIMGGKLPKLEEAYKHFTGKQLENAHTAIADVNACMAVYWAIQDHLATSSAA